VVHCFKKLIMVRRGGRLKEGDRHRSAWWRSLCRIREGVGEGVGSNVRRVVGNGSSTYFWHDIWAGEIPLKIKFPRLFELFVEKESSVEKMRRVFGLEDGRERMWRRRLLAWEEESVRECFVLLDNFVFQKNVEDTCTWLLDPIHGYSVRGAYCFLTTTPNGGVQPQVDDIWHQQIPSKVSVFVWRLLRNRLPTKDNLVRRRVLSLENAACVAGCGSQETTNHLFLECDVFGALLSQVWLWLGISSVSHGDIRQHFIQFITMPSLHRSTHMFLRIIWFTSVWVLWKERNDRVFNNTTSTPFTLIEKVKLSSFLW